MNSDFDVNQKEWLKKSNAENRLFLEKQYSVIKNIGIIFIDFVPYEKKEHMIKGLKKLIVDEQKLTRLHGRSPFNYIPDMRQRGIRSGGGRANIATVYNYEEGSETYLGVYRELPECFSSLNISVGQRLDYTYYVKYEFRFKKEYYNKDIKRIFVESGDYIPYIETSPNGVVIRGTKSKGPSREPTILTSQKDAEDFLKNFSYGLFLNKDSHLSCPNVKVIAIDDIDFVHFKNWYKNRLDFLRFLGVKDISSKVEHFLISYDDMPLLKNSSMFSGLIFLASENNFEISGSDSIEHEIFRKASWFMVEPTLNFTNIFHSIYWSNYHLEYKQSEWQQRITETYNVLRNASTLNELDILNETVVSTRQTFDDYTISENRNIDTTRTKLNSYPKTHPDVEPLEVFIKINIYESMLNWGKKLIDDEQRNIEFLTKQFDKLFVFCSNRTNISISRNNRRVQQWSLFIAIMAISFSAISLVWQGYIFVQDSQLRHPQGSYVVGVQHLSYDNSTGRDSYRVRVSYQGAGESRFLKLSINVTGSNTTVLSKVNADVMEPNVILVRNYVNGLLGWVDYEIQRTPSNVTQLTIISPNPSQDTDAKRIVIE